MESKPTVSVIMGIYNCEKTLAESIESIIAQTYTDWELIMCDDCSTDNTYNIAKSYADKYQNIVLIRNEQNMKLAYTLNKCLKTARGEYIARMDSDDISFPERFEKQVRFLDENKDYEVVGAQAIVFDENGDKLIRDIGNTEPLNKINGRFIHPTVMIRKSAYDAVGGYAVSADTLRAEDVDLWFKFKLKKYKGYVLQEPLLRYRENKNDFNKRTMKAAIGITKLHLKYYRLLNVPYTKYLSAFKPMISAGMPKAVMRIYHKYI